MSTIVYQMRAYPRADSVDLNARIFMDANSMIDPAVPAAYTRRGIALKKHRKDQSMLISRAAFAVRHAVSKDLSRPHLNGVLIDRNGQAVVGFDKKVLAVVEDAGDKTDLNPCMVSVDDVNTMISLSGFSGDDPDRERNTMVQIDTEKTNGADSRVWYWTVGGDSKSADKISPVVGVEFPDYKELLCTPHSHLQRADLERSAGDSFDPGAFERGMRVVCEFIRSCGPNTCSAVSVLTQYEPVRISTRNLLGREKLTVLLLREYQHKASK